MRKFRAVKESPEETARTFGRSAVDLARAGLTVTARAHAQTAAHFAKIAIRERERTPDDTIGE